MFKKLLLVAVVGVAGFAALKGTKFFGYAKQEIAEAQAWLDNQVPVEKEINRLRGEVVALKKDEAKVNELLASEIVDVRYLREDVEKLRTEVADQGEKLQVKADAIRAAEGNTVKFNRTIVTVAQAKEMLASDVAHHVNKKATLTNMEKSLAIRESNKEHLEKQRDTLKRQKDDLTIQVDALAAQFQALKLEQMQSKYQSDPSRLSGIKESIRNLQKKMDVERTKLDLSPRLAEEGTTSSSAGQSVDDIMAPVDGKKGDKKVSSTK